MKRCLSLWVCVVLISGFAAAADVPDRAVPADPSQVKLGGWLGGRVEANWKDRLATVSLDERLKAFRDPSESEGWSGEHIGKWLHATALMWQYTHADVLKQRMDEAVAALTACQAPDGYLGTYALGKRWGGWDVWCHKYNLIGLLSYYGVSGDQKSLTAARKIGDLLVRTFGDGPGQCDIIKSGTHVGMAATSVLEPMVLLYRATGDQRYLDFCKYIVRAYDQPNGPKIIASLDATGSVKQTANAKAYEMMSNLVGLCELYRSTGDQAYLKPCLAAYDDIVANQMYITGGTSLSEHFQQPHHLPNSGHVSENCAQVTWEQLCLQLLRITGDGKYADTLERIVYNHLLAAQRPDGRALCYFTPLAGKKPYDLGMNCCTSSGPRGIALVTTLAYMTTADGMDVNFYGDSQFVTTIGGVKVKIVQKTAYPVDGQVGITVDPEQPVEFSLRLRACGWCRKTTIALNSQPVTATVAQGYYTLKRRWQAGDRVQLQFDMPARLITGRDTNQGFVAVERGPLVLAFDARLNPGLSAGNVTPVPQADGSLPLALGTDPAGIAAQVFRCEGLSVAAEAGHAALKKVPLLLTSFAEASETGSQIAVWMRSPELLEKGSQSPFSFATESYSQPGNIEGSIADGDPTTWRVTFNGQRQAEAWFAVEAPRPATINRVVYAHGQCYHDGGWFDASTAKPRVQIRPRAGAAWQDVATIDSYPATTATDNRRLAAHQEFTVKFPAVEAVAIRVIGTPAGGDNPKQSFASCGELRGDLDK